MHTLTEDKKRLLSNFFSLSALHGINMLLPLVTLPYLVRVLGVENYGLVNFALSVIMYFNILVSFGFELSATREISVNRDDSRKVTEIFSTVMLIKAFFAFVSFLLLGLLVNGIELLSRHAALYYATFGLVVGNVLFPTWFFQGMERMKYITFINVASRIAFTVLIFVFVKESDDYIYVPILNASGAILGGLYSLWLIFRRFGIKKIVLPTRATLRGQLRESFHFFLSRVAGNGAQHLATVIVGLCFGNLIVGYFSMVGKLTMAFSSLGGILSQTIYPYMSRTRNIRFFKKLFYGTTVFATLAILPILYFNESLFLFVFGVQNSTLSHLFIIIFGASVFGIMNALVGYPLLAAFGYTKEANNSLIYASALYILFVLIGALVFRDFYLVAYAHVFNMLTALAIRFHYIRKHRLWNI
ncbi:oligosaccharide flippase family protein [Hydrogenimonas urashimensis]|uniref:oligosaccharide flippase family protein n=1 Tax=Hydrogenimonas urashimensis TaxID=2740515 RepID=UPI001915AA57|nr:oligosaccharide flippase family protein [Hydrogenimonas urashimensis]